MLTNKYFDMKQVRQKSFRNFFSKNFFILKNPIAHNVPQLRKYLVISIL